MSETLRPTNSNKQESNTPWLAKNRAPQPSENEVPQSPEHIAPRFPEDPNQYSEAELMADPAKRYHANPKDFPILAKQAEKGPNWGDQSKTLPIDETMGRFVKATADCVAILTGEDEGLDVNAKIPAADHIIYLDKSARPVCWFNNIFWDAFTDKPRPGNSFLAIDRMEWFARTDTPVDPSGYIKNTSHLARFEDFRKENVTDEDIARIRALYIPGGIEDDSVTKENIDKIMHTPTSLEGKNITIIDEVGRSGSTLSIAKYLISRAIPEAASVNGYTYWNSGVQIGPNDEQQMRGVPVWYDRNDPTGRGIGDVNEDFRAAFYEKYLTPKTLARKFGAFVLGTLVDLSKEPGGKSRELAREIKLMRKEWDAGHIMMPSPEHYSDEKWTTHLKKQGVKFVPPQPGKPLPRNSYTEILKDIQNRPPAPSK